MKTLERYLLREYLVMLMYCLFGFAMIFVIYELFGNMARLMEARPPLWLIVRFYLSILAPTMEQILPSAVMLATLYTFWSLTRHNELTAMRASGIGMGLIVRPFLLVAVVASIVSAIVKETVTPEAGSWAKAYEDSHFLSPERPSEFNFIYYDTAGYRQWLIHSVSLDRPNVFKGVEITQESPTHDKLFKIGCRSAEYLDGQWWLFEPERTEYSADGMPVPIHRETKRADGWKRVESATFITETPDDLLRGVKRWEYLSTRDMIAWMKANPEVNERSKINNRFDIQSRLAMPWACLVVALFSIPAGMRTGRQGALTGVFIGVALLFGFYGLMQFGIMLGKGTPIPPWIGAWLANMVFGVAGLIMLLRTR